jgi:hypothetical protein
MPHVDIWLYWITAPIGLIMFGIAILAVKSKTKATEINNNSGNDSLLLLGLLDDNYQRLKTLTRMAMQKLRSDEWKEMDSAYFYFMGLTDIDIESAIENIMIKNLYLFTTGKTMTFIEF